MACVPLRGICTASHADIFDELKFVRVFVLCWGYGRFLGASPSTPHGRLPPATLLVGRRPGTYSPPLTFLSGAKSGSRESHTSVVRAHSVRSHISGGGVRRWQSKIRNMSIHSRKVDEMGV